jgi:type II secretory pathway pseudopilin PulG
MKTFSRRPLAFTMLELVVVMAIITTLIGLLFPAVQTVREQAARALCSNNLRQIGVGFHAFHDANGRLPPGIGYWPGKQAYGTAAYHVLPFLEQGNLYNASFVNGFGWAGNNEGSTPVYAMPVKTFVCPSDPTAGDGAVKDNSGKQTWGACSYAGNALVFCVVSGPPTYEFLNTAGHMRLTDIKDGTSNTILFAEKYARCRNADFPEGGSFWAYWITGPAVEPLHPAFGINWTNFSVGPDSKFLQQPQPDQCDPTRASTPHPAGMNVVRADASVLTLSPNITDKTWWAAVTPSEGEVLCGAW